MTTEEWNQYFSGHWNFAGEKQGDGHIAMFPHELPRRLIKMFSFAGETVFRPIRRKRNDDKSRDGFRSHRHRL